MSLQNEGVPIEEQLQPQLPAGLRAPVIFKSKNAAVVQDLMVTQEERNPGIHSILQAPIEHKFLTPGTGVPVLEKDTLVPKFIQPAGVTLSSKFNYAMGLEEVIKGQIADRNVQDIISANHQIKDGNFVGAEETLGRPITDDEIVRRQVTPSTLSGQYNYGLNALSNPLLNTETQRLRDDLYQSELVKIQDALNRGDDIDKSRWNLIRHYFQGRRLTNIDPALREFYQVISDRVEHHFRMPDPEVKDPEPDAHQGHEQAAPRGQGEENKEQANMAGSGIGKIKKGHIKLGKYEFDRSKLTYGGVLSLRQANTRRKINGHPNRTVSNNYRDHLMYLTTGEGMPSAALNAEEQNHLHNLVRQSEADLKLRPLGLSKSKLNPEEVKQKLYTALAEVDAGNDSQKLKNEIEKLASLLQKEGHIPFSLAQNIRQHYLIN